jgi:hypothetical protein
MNRSVWVCKEVWDRLSEIKEEEKIPISGQITLALRAYWRERYGKQQAAMGSAARKGTARRKNSQRTGE